MAKSVLSNAVAVLRACSQSQPNFVALKSVNFSCFALCSMARLDRVKNLSGLAEWFAANKRIRKLVNLVIVGKPIP